MTPFRKLTLATFIIAMLTACTESASPPPSDSTSLTGSAKNYDDAEVQFQIGQNYYQKGDHKTALTWWWNSATQGNASAQYQLGELYNKGEGTPIDHAKALKWYTESANQGNMEAQYRLGEMYEKEKNKSHSGKNHTKAIEWYTKSAEQGHAPSQFKLAEMYRRGRVTPQDYDKALQLYTKSAEQGYANAQYKLGQLYYDGLDDIIPQDTNKGLEWYAKSAKQGHDSARSALSNLYRKGLYRKKEKSQQDDSQKIAEIFEWHKKFADLDVPEAQYHVGRMYANGIGTPQDHAKAVEWLTKYLNTQDAHRNDYRKAQAQYELGRMYEQGQGISQDYQKALELYTQSAEKYNADAQYKLGEAYEKGQGVPPDHNEARK